jgi:hypothetical protein
MKESLITDPHFISFNILEACVPSEIRKELNKQIPKELWQYVGKKIHIKSRRGIYTVLELVPNGIIITSKTIQHERPYLLVPFDDFKCLAGGLNNFNQI